MGKLLNLELMFKMLIMIWIQWLIFVELTIISIKTGLFIL